jgi:plastocyanin
VPLSTQCYSCRYRSVPWVLVRGGVLKGRDPISKRSARSADVTMPEGGIVKRPMYVIPISVVIAVLVFATMAVAQSVPEGQEQGQEPSQTASDANTSGVQNSTTVPPKKKPAETATPAESSASDTDTISDTDAIVGVDIDDHAFDPAQRNIAPGTRVMFINNDTEPHTATADNGLFDTGELEPGDSSWVSFEGAGTVTYHCELHPDMKGSIVVDEGGGEDTTPQKQTAKETPNDEPSFREADQPSNEAAKPARGY